MGNIIINQKIKTIKTIKDFDSFDSLINWDSVHTSYLNESPCSTEKRLLEVFMYTKVMILFPVMAWYKNQKSKK